MDERTDSGGAIVAIGVALILFLLIIVGGGFAFFFVARTTALRSQGEMARVAEAQAQMTLEQARAAQNLAAARAAAQAATPEQQSIASDDGSIPAAIESFLRVQEQAWNAGDIDRFMEHYWKSDELTFSSGGETTRGWNNTLNRYREKYPTPDKMGKLKFDKLEVTPLSDGAALVLGQWQVERESEPLSGNFSLVVRKLNDRWLIIHDHTSRLK